MTGTLTLFQGDVPCLSIYGPEIDALRATGRIVAEVGALRITDRQGPRVLRQLARAVLTQALAQGITDLVAMVHPRHVRWYLQKFNFELMGPERYYPRVGKPAVLIRLDLLANAALVRRFLALQVKGA